MYSMYYLSNFPYQFYTDICFYLNRKFHRRPSSKPYLAGDTYRKISDFLYDETYLCTAEEINNFKKSKIDNERNIPLIFVSSYRLETFRLNVLPGIKQKFVLLTHQGDINIQTENHKKIANNPFLVHWFAQNCLLTSKKITPLPIGLEDRYKHCNGALADFKNKKLINKQKLPKILFGFTLNTNPESRSRCIIALCNKPNTVEINKPLNSHLYRKKLSRFMFVASPVGNGLDCHRTWEAIYLGVVPIVENNYMNKYFQSLGLPMILIDNTKWDSLSKWTPEIMEKKFNEEWSKADLKAMWLDYWVDEINKYVK